MYPSAEFAISQSPYQIWKAFIVSELIRNYKRLQGVFRETDKKFFHRNHKPEIYLQSTAPKHSGWDYRFSWRRVLKCLLLGCCAIKSGRSACLSMRWVYFCQTTRCTIPKDSHFTKIVFAFRYLTSVYTSGEVGEFRNFLRFLSSSNG